MTESSDRAADPVDPHRDHGAFVFGGPSLNRGCGDRAHADFESKVGATPDAIALEMDGLEISYSRLNSLAEKIALEIARLRLPAESRIGLLFPPCVELVAGMIGVWKADLAWVPLDPTQPQARLTTIAADAGLDLLLAHPNSCEGPEGYEQKTIYVDVDSIEPLAWKHVRPPAPLDHEIPARDQPESQLAYIIFTSGSTGRPKGVQVEHRALANLLRASVQCLGLSDRDVVLAVANPTFDVFVAEVLSPLSIGARVVLATRADAKNGDKLRRLLENGTVSVLHATPATWQLICSAGWKGDERITLISTGEALSPALARQLLPLGKALWNLYGPTETTVWATAYKVDRVGDRMPIGIPMPGLAVCVVDEDGRILQRGAQGELLIGGVGVARGYIGQPELTASKFIPNTYDVAAGVRRWYRSGDLVSISEDGNIDYFGRIDDQLKIRGFRIEPAEVELALELHGQVRKAVVAAKELPNDTRKKLSAFIIPCDEEHPPSASSLRSHLSKRLPEYMLPSYYVFLNSFPLTPSGKVDKRALPLPSRSRPNLAAPFVPPRSKQELLIAAAWRRILGVDDIGLNDPFFELGGDSLMLVELALELSSEFGRSFSEAELIASPTIRDQADRLESQHASRKRRSTESRSESGDIAIVGIAGRFPGARNVEQFWKNLCEGKESISTRTETDASGQRIAAVSFLEGIEEFDANLFGISSRDATVMDPQHRLFLECSWEALENAGYAPGSISNAGVFCGAGFNSYLLNVLQPSLSTDTVLLHSIADLQIRLGNSSDYVGTRVSHKFGLTGPSINVQTACSTSLVAVHLACKSLLSGECGMALAGAVSISIPQTYRVGIESGLILSTDGHCRAFDAAASGTVFGSGCGVVVLKPLRQAIAARDNIRAIIKGSAVNNDGSAKIGFTAPSIEGQRDVVVAALETANVSARSLSYVEAHGTGTRLGDPIEVQALAQAFASDTVDAQSCAVGSVKTNVGHLIEAAGMAGLIKTVLSLERRLLPASLNFEAENPQINFESTPFFVNTKLSAWNPGEHQLPRRAGVSSFGFGGTNAHLILEEAPESTRTTDERQDHIFVLSGNTQKSLQEALKEQAAWLRSHPDARMVDLSRTSTSGRRHFTRRVGVVARSSAELADKLAAIGAEPRTFKQSPRIAFVFGGQGSRLWGRGKRLVELSSAYKASLERCDASFQKIVGRSLFDLLYEESGKQAIASSAYIAQPALFSAEYALAQMWRSWGIEPSIVAGHSFGEWVAACCAGIVDLETALELVTTRGYLMDSLPARGAMYSVTAGEEVLRSLIDDLSDKVSLAVTNTPFNHVISGDEAALDVVVERFRRERIHCHPMKVTHAFHSPLMVPMLEAFGNKVGAQKFNAPQLPFVRGIDGAICDRELESEYWSNQIVQPMRFDLVAKALVSGRIDVALTISPDQTLVAFGQSQTECGSVTWLPALRSDDSWSDSLETLSQLYVRGADVNWTEVQSGNVGRLVSFPGTPFDRKPYWPSSAPAPVNPADPVNALAPRALKPTRVVSVSDNLEIVEVDLDLSTPALSCLLDHCVDSRPILPMTAYVEMMFSACRRRQPDCGIEISDLSILKPILLREQDETNAPAVKTVRMILENKQADGVHVSFHCRSEAAPEDWDVHARGRFNRISPDGSGRQEFDLPTLLQPKRKGAVNLAELKARATQRQSVEAFYHSWKERGLDFGPSFRNVSELHVGKNVAFGVIEGARALQGHEFHPALLDSCIQICEPLIADAAGLLVHAIVPRVVILKSPGSKALFCLAEARGSSAAAAGYLPIKVWVFDADGESVAYVETVLRAINDTDVSRLHYTVAWDRPLLKPSQPSEFDSWLLIGPESVASSVGELLTQQDRTRYRICQSSRDVGVALQDLQRVPASRTCVALIAVHKDQAGFVESIRAVGEAICVMKAIGRAQPPVALAIVTAGATNADARLCSPQMAALWGLGRVFELENQHIVCSRMDIDPALVGHPQALANQIADSLLFLTSGKENELALRNDRIFCSRIKRSKPTLSRKCRIRSDATYLVTGASGALGTLITNWLVQQGARRIVLNFRGSSESGSLRLRIAQWEAQGVEIQVSLGDISDIEVAREAVNLANAERRLSGVFHAAGVVEDKTILGIDEATIHEAMKAKLGGAHHLHELTFNLNVEHFVLFSSVAGILGAAGQGVYAAANTYLDALACYRATLGLEAISISWGAWSTGMVSRLSPVQRKRLAARGMNPMSERKGLQLLEQILSSDAAHCVAADVTWDLWFDQYKALPARFCVLDEGLRRSATSPPRTATAVSANTGEVVAEEISRVLGLASRQELDPERNLFELGLDSLGLIDLSFRLSNSLRRQIPSSLFLSNPTLSMALKALENEADIRKSVLVPLSSTSKETPLFCVPGVLGMPLGMVSLADCLPDLAVYSFRSFGLEEDDQPIESIEEIAAAYIDELIRIRPSGPFHLVGHSFGGKVVFEMARQLLERKKQLERIAIVDIQVKPSDREKAAAHWTDAQLVLDYCRAWSGTLGQDFSVSTEDLLPLSDVARRRWLQQTLNSAGLSFGETAIDRLLRVYRANLIAYGRYVPRAMDGEITVELIRASEVGVFDFLPGQAETEIDPAWGWRDLVRTVNVHICPGNHYSIVSQPNVPLLCRRIERMIDRARG